MARDPLTLQFGEQVFDVTREASAEGSVQSTFRGGETFDVLAIGDAEYRVAQAKAGNDGYRQIAICAVEGSRRWIFLDGGIFVVEVRGQGDQRRRSVATNQGLTAPMPATVTKIIASVGDHVKRGQTLLVLEAMKMEMPVKSPADGVVKKINCEPNQLVQPDVQLIDLE